MTPLDALNNAFTPDGISALTFPEPVNVPIPLAQFSRPGMSTIQIPNATILSVYPMQPKNKHMHHGIIGVSYTLPASDRTKIITRTYNPYFQMGIGGAQGSWAYEDSETPAPAGTHGYVLLHLNDARTMIKNYLSDGGELIPQLIAASEITHNLVNHWCSSILGQMFSPGIAQLDRNRPFDEQLDAVIARQREFFVALVEQADQLAANRNWTAITNLHRVAARYLNVPDRDWVRGLVPVEAPDKPIQKSCPVCRETLDFKALGCHKCSTFLPEFYRKYPGAFTRDLDPVAFDFMDQMQINEPVQVKLAPKPSAKPSPPPVVSGT